MFELTYTLSGSALDIAPETDIANADAGDLDFRLFLGDIVLKHDEVNFSTNWGWLPVFYYASCFREIANNLKRRKEEQFEFTESEATIFFAKKGNEVFIRANYAPGEIQLSYEEFTQATEKLLQNVADELVNGYPNLKENPVFKKRLKHLA